MTNEAPTHEEFRAIGFTGDAAMFKRSPEAQEAFEAWFGEMPDGHEYHKTFKYSPNEVTHAAWERVGDIIRAARGAGR